MKPLKIFFYIIFSSLIIVATAAESATLEFVTPRDLTRSNAASNINLLNNRNTAATVYGLYVRQFAYVTPGSACDSASIIYPASQNITAGSNVMPVTIPAKQSVALGSNYLYNMIYEAMYYVTITSSVSPPGCALPGCTWGSDTTIYNWCIYLGALAPVTTSAGYTANVAPAADAASGVGYNYNLISSYTTLGPISCNDQTLTCSVATSQTQSFS